ncbi:hypothetical protein [Caldalkalibacillus salinus]|uniref:hypothetical protein n=1 Tax=Caldalkalibacillus salinus TaxID=2803787 RepID=UPI0019204DE8|nr:hypothetical protein [Caldalkalibacillus salinus]
MNTDRWIGLIAGTVFFTALFGSMSINTNAHVYLTYFNTIILLILVVRECLKD